MWARWDERTPPRDSARDSRRNSLRRLRTRRYSCGNSNVGLFPHALEYGDVKIEKVFFGISQSVSSPASYVSSVTVDGALNLAVAYCEPIWAADEAAKFTDDLVAICERVGLAESA